MPTANQTGRLVSGGGASLRLTDDTGDTGETGKPAGLVTDCDVTIDCISEDKLTVIVD